VIVRFVDIGGIVDGSMFKHWSVNNSTNINKTNNHLSP